MLQPNRHSIIALGIAVAIAALLGFSRAASAQQRVAAWDCIAWTDRVTTLHDEGATSLLGAGRSRAVRESLYLIEHSRLLGAAVRRG